jgi:hypothetical protein
MKDGTTIIKGGSHLALVNELVILTSKNPIVNNMLSLLSSGIENTGPMPNMDLFTNNNFPLSAQLSALTIQQIVDINCFEMLHASRKGSGLWIVSSFFNHDTYPNTISEMYGKLKTYKALKNLKSGTEITSRYTTDLTALKKWGIKIHD